MFFSFFLIFSPVTFSIFFTVLLIPSLTSSFCKVIPMGLVKNVLIGGLIAGSAFYAGQSDKYQRIKKYRAFDSERIIKGSYQRPGQLEIVVDNGMTKVRDWMTGKEQVLTTSLLQPKSGCYTLCDKIGLGPKVLSDVDDQVLSAEDESAFKRMYSSLFK